jgi:hypothetical protein
MQLSSYFLVVLGIFALLTLILNGNLNPGQIIGVSAPFALEAFLRESKTNSRTGEFSIQGLSCTKFGGPSDEDAQEMVYWRDIPPDSLHISPFKRRDGTTQYLTFEPDFGGWNNIRMGMETVVALAFAMGRTLVLVSI